MCCGADLCGKVYLWLKNTNAKKRNKKSLADQRLVWSFARCICHLNTTQSNSAILPPFWRFCYKDPQEGTSCIYVDPGHQIPSGGLVPAATDDATDSLHSWSKGQLSFFLEARSDPCFVCPCKKYNWHAELSMAELFERPKDQNHSLNLVRAFDYVDIYCKDIEGKKSTWDYVSSQARGEG